jgi:protocatechuate 3,4-dioxygenase beta subunit
VKARRRDVVAAIAGLAYAALDGSCSFAAAELDPTPECHDGEEPTLRETEGPFFKPRSPERANLREGGLEGRAIELSGRVLTRSCRPVSAALIDLWHANAAGEYDTKGFRLRGHQFTDAQGRYAFSTIVPGAYGPRTRHFHFKVQPPRRSVLTTQLYFPGEPANEKDRLFRRELLLRVVPSGDGLGASFDFVLDVT